MSAGSAEEELAQYLGRRDHHTSHPEDRLDASDTGDEQAYDSSEKRQIRSGAAADPDDEDRLPSMAASSTAAYHIPHQRFDANTGPKGVIADAQSFNRAKQSILRRAFANITHTITSKAPPAVQEKAPASDSGSNSDLSVGDDDEEFMNQWRTNRLAELSAAPANGGRRKSPSRRNWGTLDDVDANGYLDAIEKVGDDVVVVVCIYDLQSTISAQVEDVLGTLAYKYSTTRFVKLHHDIAEMTHIAIPAILAYNRGDVFATLSDCRADGLEKTLQRQGILQA